MSTHPYKHRSKPSKRSQRSQRFSTWNSRIFCKPATENTYDGGKFNKYLLDEMPMWAQPESNPHEIIFHNKEAYDQFSDGVKELYFGNKKI